MSRAYETRDIHALRALLSRDFLCGTLGFRSNADLDREHTLELAANLFASPRVDSLSLEFSDDYEMIPDPATGNWVLSDVCATMTILGEDVNGLPGPLVLRQICTFVVRPVREPGLHFVISEQLAKGCDSSLLWDASAKREAGARAAS